MKNRFRGHRWLLMGVVSAVLLVAAIACGEDATPVPTATTPPLATATSVPPTTVPTEAAPAMMEPTTGGIIPMQSLCDPLLPMIQLASFCGQLHAAPLYNTITEFNPETPDPLDIRGDLATSWEVSSDDLTYTFKLAKNAMFSDGNPVTAEDAAFSLILNTDPGSISKVDYPAVFEETGGTRRGGRGSLLANYLKSATALDANTLELKLNFPSGAFLLALSNDEMAVQRKQQLAGADAKIPSFRNPQNLIGSGPFTLKSFKKEVSTEHERNPNYFKEGRPYVDGLIHFPIVDKVKITAAYKTGQVLMADSIRNGLNVVQASKLADEIKDRATIYWSTSGGMAVLMNTRVAPFDDPRVRKAMILVFHRQPMIKTITLDKAIIGTPLPPGMSWTFSAEEAVKFPGLREDPNNPGKKHPGDLKEAQDLTVAAGYGPGTKVTLACLNAEEYCDVAVILKDQMKQFLGWEATIEQGEVAPLYARYVIGDFQFASHAFSCGIPDPDGCKSNYSKGSQRHEQITGYFNPDAQPLWEAQQIEPDPTKRRDLMLQINDLLLEDNHASVLYHSQLNWIVYNKIQNFNIPNTSGAYRKHEHLWCDPAC